MSVIGLQRRLLGSGNRIHWRGDDVARLAKYFGHEGPIAPLMAKREAMPVMMIASSDVEKSDDGAVYTWRISTGGTDRSLDQIAVNGWNLTNYPGNPLVLYGHGSAALPIGRSLWTGPEGGALKARMVFSGDEFAQRVKRLVDERVLRAASVGFRPGTWQFSKDPARRGGIDFISGHELLEWSVVDVPCQPQCLLESVQGAKAVTATIVDMPRSAPTQSAASRATIESYRRRLEELRGRK